MSDHTIPSLQNVSTGALVHELNSRGHNPEDDKAEQIISFVARRYEIDRATLLTGNQEAKQVAAHLIRTCTSLRWADISGLLGYTDHTGAVYACKKGKEIYQSKRLQEKWTTFDKIKTIGV